MYFFDFFVENVLYYMLIENKSSCTLSPLLLQEYISMLVMLFVRQQQRRDKFLRRGWLKERVEGQVLTPNVVVAVYKKWKVHGVQVICSVIAEFLLNFFVLIKTRKFQFQTLRRVTGILMVRTAWMKMMRRKN